MSRCTIILLSLFFLSSCRNDPAAITGNVDAFVPVYGKITDINKIEVVEKQPTVEPGKIYVYQSYIFQNDVNTGIHIIDNRDKKNPEKIAFLRLPLTTELAVKDNYLYTNNNTDLVVFDLSNPSRPRFVKRVPDVFPQVNQTYPPVSGVYFECPDPSKGVVLRWERKNIPVPNCRR